MFHYSIVEWITESVVVWNILFERQLPNDHPAEPKGTYNDAKWTITESNQQVSRACAQLINQKPSYTDWAMPIFWLNQIHFVNRVPVII